MFNEFHRSRAFPYQESEFDMALTQGVNLHELRVRISAVVTIAGGTVSGAVVEDGPARLLERIRVLHDGFHYVEPVGGVDLLYLNRRLYPQVSDVQTLANADAQVDTPISVEFTVPFTWDYLADPYDVFLTVNNIRSEFRAYLQLATGETTAASDAGTAVIVDGGDRTVSISDFSIRITEVYSVSSRKPQFLPVITQGNTRQIAAADADLPFELRSSRRVAAHLFQYRNDSPPATQADSINALTLIGGNTRWYDGIPYTDFKTAERNRFPAVPATENGTVLVPYVSHGKLGTALNPKVMGTDPRWLFDVDAPGTNPGYVRVLGLELRVIPGVTVVEVE